MVKNVEKWDFSSTFLEAGGGCSVQVQSDVQWMDFTRHAARVCVSGASGFFLS